MKTNLIHLSAAITLGLAGTLFAADEVPAPITPPSSTSGVTAPASTGFQGKITAVDQAAKTVTILDKDGKSMTLHIGETTRLSRGDASSANWTDLKVGSEISGLQKAHGSMSHAETLTISNSTGEAK